MNTSEIPIQESDHNIAPVGSDIQMGAVLKDAPGCSVTGNVFPECKQQYRAILNHRFQLTGLLSPDGRLLVANKVALNFAGVSEQEVLGRLFWETPWWTHSEEVQNRLKDAIEKAASGSSIRFEITEQNKHGELRMFDFSLSPVFDENGDVVYLVPEGFDITEEKTREASIRESEERYRILVETASDAIFMMKGDMFVECNQKMLDIFECNREQILGCSILDFSPHEQPSHVDSGKVITEKNEVALEGEPQHFDWVLTKYDGTPFEAEVSFNKINLSTGPHIQGCLKDVTKRNQSKEERKELQERLQQSQKMEAIGTLAAGIAHDFNNILSPIIGYAELSMSQVQENSPLRKYQHHILKAAVRARDLVSQVLAFSRKGDEVIRPVKVKIILKETLKLIRASLPSNIDVVEKIDNDGVIMSSPTQVQQVVMNLCTNASHAMKENGGLLQICLVEEDLGEEFTNYYDNFAPGHYLKLTVSDTGYGITPEILQSIFNPYFTTKEKGEGTGLGLSMVHGIVKSCGGEILVDSKPGKGSVFSVYFPVASGTEEKEMKSDLATPGGFEKILVVDDEKAILKMFTRFLEQLGYNVTARVSSIEALEAFKRNPKGFDLVITDLTMPDMTGDRLAKEINKIRSDIPIILSTGYGNRISEKSTEAIGVDALLMKPVLMSDLSVTIRQLIDNRRNGQ